MNQVAEAQMSRKPARPTGVRREALLLALAVWTVFIVNNTVFTQVLGVHPFSLVSVWVWALHGMLLTWAMYLIMRRTEGVDPVARWTVVAASVVLLSLLQTWLDVVISAFIMRTFSPEGMGPFAIMLKTRAGLEEIGFEITLMICFWLFAMYAVSLGLLQAQRRTMEAQVQARKAQLAALRLQLNPHFLLNALNTVSSLIVTRRNAEADAATMNLAEFLHGALTSDGERLVRLNEELATVEAYLRVEEVRFGDKLQVEWDIPEPLSDLLVPDFLLQPLVENAVKYAVAPAKRPVTVEVQARRDGEQLKLTVKDNGDPERAALASAGTGLGLQNTRARLDSFYGEAARLEVAHGPGGFEARLTLPAVRAAPKPEDAPWAAPARVKADA